MILLSLLACDPDSPEKVSHADSGTDSATDTASPADSGHESSPPESVPPDSAETGGDTGTWLSSDEAVSAGDCDSVEPICSGGACTLDIAVTTATVSGRFAPGSQWGLRFSDPRVDIAPYNLIRGSAWGLYTPFGTFATWPEGDTYSLRAFTGTWNVSIEKGGRGDQVRGHIPIASVTVTGDLALDVDPGFHAVTGTVTAAGDAHTGNGTLRFEDASSGAWVETYTYAGVYEVDLSDGTWDITYTPMDSTDLAVGTWPAGTVTVAGGDVEADVDLDAPRVSGTLLIDGAVLDSLPYSWSLWFVNADGESWWSAFYGGEEWDTRLPPGTWQVRVSEYWVVGTDVAVADDTVVDLANDPIVVTGTVTLNGEPLPEGWSVELVDPAIDFTYEVTEPTFSLEMHPATYDVYLHRTSVEERVATGIAIATDGTLDLPLEVATLEGRASWDGAAPADGWRVYFVDTTSGDSSYVHVDAGARWSVTLPVGTYDVYVWVDRPGVGMPVAVARALVVDGDRELGLRVNTWPVSGSVSVDGVPAEYGTLYLHDASAGDTFTQSLDEGGATWSERLPAGTYTFLGNFGSVYDDGTTHLLPVGICVGISG